MQKSRKKAGILTLLLLGLIFTGAGGAIVHFMGHDVTFSCDRSADECVIEKTDYRGESEVVRTFPLSDLQGAEVQETRDSEGDYTYKVVLLTNQGEIPLTSYTSSGKSKHEKRAATINKFVRSDDPELVVEQSGKLIRWAGYLFFGVGVLMLLGLIGKILKVFLLLILAIAKRG